jgi:hypothetical protein
MIAEIKQAIADKLNELYTTTVYDEILPEDFTRGSFLITVIEYSYSKTLTGVFRSSIPFGLSYFPADTNNPRNECLAVQERILKEFDLLGGFRISAKSAQIVDDVLHIQFTVRSREMITEAAEKMNTISFE